MILGTDKELVCNLRAQVPGGASLIPLPDSVHLLLTVPSLFSHQLLHTWPALVFHPPTLLSSTQLWACDPPNLAVSPSSPEASLPGKCPE